MKKILFVCTGNTCRSPMAQTLANDIFMREGLELKAYSCGVFAGEGGCASTHALSIMAEYGLELCSHETSPISQDLAEEAAAIFTMTKAHKSHVLQVLPHLETKVQTLGGDEDVSDPFGGNLDVYRDCAAQIKSYLEKNDWGKF
ncbi:MAG: low molecular weight protein arginine phosphatase [Defluviitaleaceae bacterium]|nr:low molecular weight protein arginine phosphatase [Defluviitaleaceae bacterium]